MASEPPVQPLPLPIPPTSTGSTRVRILQRPSTLANPLSKQKAFYLVAEDDPALQPPQPDPVVPMKDVGKEAEVAHRRLDTMIGEWPRWLSYNTNVQLEDLVVHNEAEYAVLRNARFQFSQNSKAFLDELNAGFVKAIPKPKKSIFHR